MSRSLVVIFLCVWAQVARASFDFAPIIATLTPTGAGATASFTVSNPGDTKIPVQVTVVAREPDENGKEVYAETDAVSEMFRIFPGQIVLNPKETRTVRISYVGDPKLNREIAIRMIAEELPVDVSDPNKVYKKAVAKVSIATKYVGSLYVTPVGTKSEIVVSASLIEIPDPKDLKKDEKNAKDDKKAAKAPKAPKMIKALAVELTNKGTAHQIIRKPVLKISAATGGTDIAIDSAETEVFANMNILAGKTRKAILTWPKDLPVGPVKASFEFLKE